MFHIHENVNYSIDGFHPIIYKTRTRYHERTRGPCTIYKRASTIYLSVFNSYVYESLFVEIGNALIGNKPIIIAILYRPNTPPLADIDDFIRHLYTALNKMNEEHK